MKQITLSKITYQRMINKKWSPPLAINDVVENADGTVSFMGTTSMYEGLELLGDDMEQSLIKIMNNSEKKKNA